MLTRLSTSQLLFQDVLKLNNVHFLAPGIPRRMLWYHIPTRIILASTSQFWNSEFFWCLFWKILIPEFSSSPWPALSSKNAALSLLPEVFWEFNVYTEYSGGLQDLLLDCSAASFCFMSAVVRSFLVKEGLLARR
jgi:hypothetical protein